MRLSEGHRCGPGKLVHAMCVCAVRCGVGARGRHDLCQSRGRFGRTARFATPTASLPSQTRRPVALSPLSKRPSNDFSVTQLSNLVRMKLLSWVSSRRPHADRGGQWCARRGIGRPRGALYTPRHLPENGLQELAGQEDGGLADSPPRARTLAGSGPPICQCQRECQPTAIRPSRSIPGTARAAPTPSGDASASTACRCASPTEGATAATDSRQRALSGA